MFSRSHRSRTNKAQGFAKDQELRTAEAQRSLLAELGLISSTSSTARFGGRSSRRTDGDRRPNDYASSTASARSYGIASYPEKSKALSASTASPSPPSLSLLPVARSLSLSLPLSSPLFAHLFLLGESGKRNCHPQTCVYHHLATCD